MSTSKSPLEVVCRNKLFWIIFPGIPLGLWLIEGVNILISSKFFAWVNRQLDVLGELLGGPGRGYAGVYVLLAAFLTVCVWGLVIQIIQYLF